MNTTTRLMSNDPALHFPDEWQEAWDDFHQQGVADVRAALNWTQERIPTLEDREELALENGRLQEAKRYKQTLRSMRRRATGLSMLLDYMVTKGPSEVKEFSKIAGEEKRQLHPPLPAKYERRLRAALRVLTDSKGIKKITEEAAQDPEVNVGETAVRKTLQGQIEERYGISINRDAETFRQHLRREAVKYGLKDELNEQQLERVEKLESVGSS